MIDSKLLDILACPECHGDLEYKTGEDVLVCVECEHAYKVKNGIPLLIVEDKAN